MVIDNLHELPLTLGVPALLIGLCIILRLSKHVFMQFSSVGWRAGAGLDSTDADKRCDTDRAQISWMHVNKTSDVATWLYAPPAADYTEEEDADTLLWLKLHFNDSGSGVFASWVGHAPCTSNWAHVHCSAEERVTAIELAGAGLSGTLPPLTGLPMLQRVDLSNNNITGIEFDPVLPLPTLQVLLLPNNQLSGTGNQYMQGICTAYPELKHLDISGNMMLEDLLPDCWGDLAALEGIKAASTNMTGPLPASWGDLANLKELNLSNTRWQLNESSTFPRQWSNMQNLKILDLSGSRGYTTMIQGRLPGEWFTGMQMLHTFVCHHCNWVMAADPAMTQWPQLQYLDISFNPLDAGTPTLPPIWASTNMSTNRLPDSWVQIRLEVLKVRGCSLTAAGPTMLANWTAEPAPLLSSLKVLDLGANPTLQLSHMEQLFGQMKLWELHVDSTAVSLAPNSTVWPNPPCILDYSNNTALIDQLGLQPQLLYTSDTGICRANATVEWELLLEWSRTWKTSNRPNGWEAGNMPSGANSSCPATAWEGVSCDAATGRVSVIELTGRHLCDPVPCALPQQLFFKLSGLEAFKIPGVNIAASFLGPSALNLNGSRRLRVLDLSNNTGVRGPLGPPWPLLADGSLEYLNLSHCNLTGELPDNFPRNLRKLVLSHNSLQGPLPNFTSTGSDVELLDLSFNNLSGTLPNWSGRLGSLTASPVQILLQSNQLTGPLPEWSSLWKLKVLDVSNNSLTGFMPSTWVAKSPQLEDLRMSLNKFRSGLPQNWGDQTLDPSLNLRRFECSHCGLSGNLPTWGSNACSDGLQYVDLSGNNFSSMITMTWSALSSLKHLDMSWNQLTGTLFASATLCPMESLEVIKVAHNNISGLLFGGLASTPISFPALQVLDISYNQFTGTLPVDLPGTVSQLYMDHNKLTGSIPAVFADSGTVNGSFQNLHCWSLDHNPGLCGPVPSNAPCFDRYQTNISYHCQTLQPLPVTSHCTLPPALQDSGSTSTTTFPTCDPSKVPKPSPQAAALLAWKDSFNKKTALDSWQGQYPCHSQWRGIECDGAGVIVGLHLRGLQGGLQWYGPTPINWEALANVSTLRALELEDLCPKGASGCTFPPEFSQLTNLEIVNLGNSGLGGPLPDSWGQLIKLQKLNISNLAVYPPRSIPASWSTMISLHTLEAQQAALQGPLNDLLSAGGLPSLQYLLLGSSFGLSGSLPESWASRSLQVIDLSDNPVQGSLPASWAAANTSISQSLRELYLHATLLEGSVPNSWSDNFPKLHLFTIWGSRMCGPPPQSTIGMGRWCIDPTRTSMGFTCIGWERVDQVASNCTWQNVSMLKGPSPLQKPQTVQDRDTLRSVRSELGAPTLFQSWEMSDYPCGSPPWDRVGCGQDGSVESLHWSGMGLSGSIPASLGKLQALQWLDVSANKFTGELPAWGQGGSMRTLRELNASSNLLIGSLPATFSHLTSLVQLDLSHNNFSGGLPDTWGTCNISETSPPPCLGSLHALRCISCGLSGSLPAGWSDMQLAEVHLPRNHFSGGLPDSWMLLRLRHIDLEGNQLSAMPRSEYWSTTMIQWVNLERNALAGTLPAGWGDSELRTINLAGNSIIGPIPADWLNGSVSRLRLEYINLASNMLSGTIPFGEWHNSSSSLTTLILSNNPNLTGDLSNSTLPLGLALLHVANTNVSGSFSSDWMAMQGAAFSCFVAYGNPHICGPVPDNLPCSLVEHAQGTNLGKDCSTLSSLNSTGNCVPVSMSDCAPYLSDAKVLYNWKVMLADPNGRLSDWDGGPDICGPTTPWAGIKCNENRTAVTSVNISGFGVIGPLPNSLGQLSFLQSLDVSNNRFYGELPANLSQTRQLSVLKLSNNSLTGTLPSSWSNLQDLRKLVASHNNLQGVIPASWGVPWESAYLRRLEELSCDRCNISGSLPGGWFGMTNLRVISLADNNITGQLVSFGADNLESLVMDRNPMTWLDTWLVARWKKLKKLSLQGCNLQSGLLAEWNQLPLEYLDLSLNRIDGSLPEAWFNVTTSALSRSLQVMYLAGNLLSGPIPSHPGAFSNLSCWNLDGNVDLCGPAPQWPTCGSMEGTHLGQQCGNVTPIASNVTCAVTNQGCPLQVGSTFNPSVVDVRGLLALKMSVYDADAMCTAVPAPPACAIFSSWDRSNGLPCSAANCSACTLQHNRCGESQQGTNTTTCMWRSVECTNWRVRRILLDTEIVNGSTPNLRFTALPPELSTLSHLEELHLSRYPILSGGLPEQLALLSRLKVLHLQGSQSLLGTLPSSWSSLTNLTSLWLLEITGLIGSMPESWSRLTNLRQLRLTNSVISGSLPSAWGTGMTQIEQLHIVGMDLLSGSWPGGWASGMPLLTDLHLENLPSLALPNTSMTAWIINPAVSHIVIRAVPGMTGIALPPTLPTAYPNITNLVMSKLGLIGSIPSEWNSASWKGRLRLLDLRGNFLNGTLPEWLASVMGDDAILDLSSNNLTGLLPPSWGLNTTFHRTIDLSFNQFIGVLPSEWASLVYRTVAFNISFNKLQGSLGNSWYNSSMLPTEPPRLTVFGINENPCLCGGVPEWLGRAGSSALPDTTPMPSLSPTPLPSTVPGSSPGPGSSPMDGNATSNLFNLPYDAAKPTIYQSCGHIEVQQACAQNLWPPELLQDTNSLLALKALAADSMTTERLSSWNASVAACTDFSLTGDCILCDDIMPDSSCGTVGTNNTMYCNWRYIECKNGRVASILMNRTGLIFSFLPPALANATQLQVLDLSGSTVLSGSLPPEYAAWSTLTVFRLSGGVSGSLPAAYSAWSQLTVFELINTKLNGTIHQAYLQSWPMLQRFHIDGALLSGNLPEPWNCPDLTHYWVQNTPVISGPISCFNGRCYPVLAQLRIPWMFTGRAANLTRVKTLGLGGTQLRLPSWTNIKEALKLNNWALETISFPETQLTGLLGPLTYYFPQLRMLDLSSNQLSGIVPPDLAGTGNLMHVNLSMNALYGTLPAQIVEAFAPGHVHGLDLSGNMLTGPLPPLKTSSLTTFWRISLGGNLLEGAIPDSWSPLMLNSEEFNISNLRLRGPLPPAFLAANMTAGYGMRKHISFKDNMCLCGELPGWFVNMTISASNSLFEAINGTGLGATCPVNCTYPPAATYIHPDWPGLHTLRAAISGGPWSIRSAINYTWSGTTHTPCHDVDPNCKFCPFSLPANLCGSPVLDATGAPAYFCNAHAVACTNGRITNLNVSWTALEFSQLPASGLAQFTKLQELNFEGVSIHDTIAASVWTSLPYLVAVRLSGNSKAIYSSFPADAVYNPNLRHIAISNATFATALPSWTNITSLQSLVLRNITLQPSVLLPNAWANLLVLAQLEMDTVKGLAGAIPASWITGFPQLTVLSLRNLAGLTTTTSAVTQLLGQAARYPGSGRPGMTAVALSGCNLTGTIPMAVFAYTGLTSLDLAHNQFTGDLHAYDWKAFTSLRHVNLTNNKFSGSLPASWGVFRGAAVIDASRNNITGSLPASWSEAGADGLMMPLAFLDVSRNSLTGTLPDSWKDLPAQPATWLNFAFNKLTGSIPLAWASRNTTMFPDWGVWQHINVSYNPGMCGYLPSWWYARFDWPQIAVSLLQGTRLSSGCRPKSFESYLDSVEAYYPTAGRPLNLQLITKLPFKETVSGYSWQVYMATPLNGTLQPVGAMQKWKSVDDIEYYWSFTVPGYLLLKSGDYSFMVVKLQEQADSTFYRWNSTMSWDKMLQNAAFTAILSSRQASNVEVVNNNLKIWVFPPAVLADASRLHMDAERLDVHGSAVVTLILNDLDAAPIKIPSNTTTLLLNGTVSGVQSLTLGNFTQQATGVYTYTYTAMALERVSFTLYIDNMPATCHQAPACVGNSITVAVDRVLLSAVDAAATANSTLIQRDGETTRTRLITTSAALLLPTNSWHVVYQPLAKSSGGVFYRNPGLHVQLMLNVTDSLGGVTNNTLTNSTTNATLVVSNQTALVTPKQLNFTGYWSSSNKSYVIAFQIPAAGVWTAHVEIKQSTNSSASIVFRNALFNVSTLLASAAKSSFSILGTRKAGDILSIAISLRSFLGRPVTRADYVRVAVRGSLSGTIDVGALVPQPNSTWTVAFVPAREETLTVQVVVDNQGVGSQTVVIAGRSAAYLAFNTSMQQATLQAQGSSVTTVITESSLLLAYSNESSAVNVPVIDRAGERVTLDPGLKAVLTLIPPPLDAALLSKYNTTSGNSTRPAVLHRRALLQYTNQDELPYQLPPLPELLQQGTLEQQVAIATQRHLLQTSSDTKSNTTSYIVTGDLTYFADYESVEAPDPESPYFTAPVLPPSGNQTQNISAILGNNSSSAAGPVMGPDLGNLVQDFLSKEPGVTTVQGVFDAFKAAYSLQVVPPAALTYTVVLSLRHPAIPASFVVRTFQLAVVPNPALTAPSVNTTTSSASAVTAASITLFNPLLNPRFDFAVTLNRLSAASYPGGSAQALEAFKGVVAANAALDGPSWVVASIITPAPLRINATAWFPSNYANVSSPFQGLSALKYYAFLLSKLPTVAFSMEAYPAFVATDAVVANFTITLPGAAPVNGSTYGTSAAPASSTDTTTTTASAPTAAITVVNIQASDLAVVVAPTSQNSTATPPPVDLSKIVDTTAPVLTLTGDVFVAVLETDPYTDAGATAYDNVDGNSVTVIRRLQLCLRPVGMETAVATDSRALSCGAALAAVNTTAHLRSNETYVFTYTARDSAGNQAVPLRRYVVVNSRCPAAERWCPSLSACSVQGLCLATMRAATAAPSILKAAAAVFVPTVDKTPPQLKLLGTGRAAITATGAAIMMDNATWKSTWEDPGASAFDAVDGNLTSRVQSFGAGAVDTSMPTAPGRDFSYVVEYAVEDKSGNAAPVARRLVRVVCPAGQSYCIDPDTTKGTCTVNGVCGASTMLSFGVGSGGPTAAGAIGQAASSTSPAAGGAATSRAAAAAAVAPPTPPTISLLVPGPVQIAAGQVYDRCAENAPLGAVCERGVSAEDDKDGNMDRQVLVCGSRWRPTGSQRAVPVLLACSIPPEVPGDYSITFSVVNSAGLVATVRRSITIKAVCPSGESLCPDKVTCSEGGTCVSASASATPSTSSAKPSATSTAATTPAVMLNQAPLIMLINGSGFDSIVQVKRCSSYSVCKNGVLPTDAEPCEPGAIAVDPDGLHPDDSSPAKPLNKTADIVVCPPANCLTRGCSPVELRRHYFVSKGLQGCGIDTTTAEGTQFKVDFWVWDNGNPVLNASVVRTVVVSNPCPDPSASYYCSDAASGNSFCSGSPCAIAERLMPPVKAKPSIKLLPDAGPVYMQYGTPAPMYVGPCSSGAENSSCGAVASQNDPTRGVQDLTPYILVTQTAECDSADGRGCPACDLSALSAAGSCMPGTYLLTYSVTGDDGTVEAVTRRLHVYQAVYLTAAFSLYTGIDNGTHAEQLATDLLNATSEASVEGARQLLSNLTGELAARIEPSDVSFIEAQAYAVSESSWSLNATARLYLYNPSAVHKKDVDMFSSKLTAYTAATAPGQRRLAALGLGDHISERSEGSAAESVIMRNSRTLEFDRIHHLPNNKEAGTLDYHVSQIHCRLLGLQQAMQQSSNCSVVQEGGSSDCLITSASGETAGGGRQLLQANGNTLDALITDLQTSMMNDLGATDTSTTELTPQQIDMLQVYLSSLTSTVKQVEQRVQQLSTGGAVLATNINLAYGNEAEQRESESETQVTNAYQELVTHFDAMVTAVNTLADQALADFNGQMAAAADRTAAMQDAVTAMREAAALAEAMQQKYLEQTLMINAATGQTSEGEVCNRTRYLNVNFVVSRSNGTSESATASRKRQLLASTGTVDSALFDQSSAEPLTQDTASWEGYQVSLRADAANRAVDETDIPELSRYLGASPGHNKVIGGLFLHTTRRTEQQNSMGCSGSGFQAMFDFRCQKSAVPLARNTTLLSQYLSTLFAGDTDDVYPYGVDPAFLRTSEALYRPELQGHESWFYNASDPAEVPPTTGTPYGFFHQQLKGYPPGFPVLIPTRASQQRSALAMQYLFDGNYLDKKSRGFTAELLTYNADLRVLGYVKMTFDWQADGAITGFLNMRAIPAIKLAAEGGSSEVAAWLVPLWVLCLAFCFTAAMEARSVAARYPGKRWFKMVFGSGDCVLSLTVAICMLVTTLLLTAYCAAVAPAIKPKVAYEMYDAISSRARMFMPAKLFSSDAVATAEVALANSSLSLADAFDAGQLPLEPGSAGRWILPSVTSDWHEWASLMQSLHSSVGVWSAYTLLQGIILVLLVVKLVRAWSFQSKLGIICNTLLKAAPELAHLMLIIFSCILLFAVLANLGIGYRVSYNHSYAAAAEETFRALLGLGYVKLQQALPEAAHEPWPQALLSLLIYYTREVLFVMVLVQYFMATLGSVFCELKRQTEGAKSNSIPQDVIQDVCPEVNAKAVQLLRGPEYSTTARDDSGAAVQMPAGAEALQAFLAAKHPAFLASKLSGTEVPALLIGGRFLDTAALQNLLADMAVSDSMQDSSATDLLTQQAQPAKTFAQQASAMLAAGAPNDSDPGGMELAAVGQDVAGTWGGTEVELVGAAAVVAGALAAAQQLMNSLGRAIDTQELEEARLQLWQVIEFAGAGQELLAGTDYTAEDLQSVIDRELELHRQIYSAIWAAVAAMERWSTGVHKWLVKITKDLNGWLATNAELLAQQHHGSGLGYLPVPMPGQINLSESLRPMLPAANLELQQEQQAYGTTVLVTAGQGSGFGIRHEADLVPASKELPDRQQLAPAVVAGVPGGLQGIVNEYVSNTGSGLSHRVSFNKPAGLSTVLLDLSRAQGADLATPVRHRLGSTQGQGGVSTSIRSPGGVSLHTRAAQTPAGESPGVASTIRGLLWSSLKRRDGANSPDAVENSPGYVGSLFRSDAADPAGSSRSSSPGSGGSTARERPHSAGRSSLNRVVPLNIAPVLPAAAGSTSLAGGDESSTASD